MTYQSICQIALLGVILLIIGGAMILSGNKRAMIVGTIIMAMVALPMMAIELYPIILGALGIN